MIERINNPNHIDQQMIDAILAQGNQPVIQFSEPCYDAPLLAQLDALCQHYGNKLQLRFYGHYQQDCFDAQVLRQLPHVVDLSIDCLQQIHQPQCVAQLEHLQALSFGVYQFQQADFLQSLPLEQLTQLSLGESRNKQFDLAPLARAQQLQQLFVVGFTRHIDVLAQLTALQRLSLVSIGKKQSLAFINEIANLRQLKLLLGGRESLAEIEHNQLQSLEIVRVKGLQQLGDLSRFTQLQSLRIEDQLQLQQLQFSAPLASLQQLLIITCKNLTQLQGIDHLSQLRHLRAYRTALDIDQLLTQDLPATLHTLAVYSGKQKLDREIRARLDGLGYHEFY